MSALTQKVLLAIKKPFEYAHWDMKIYWISPDTLRNSTIVTMLLFTDFNSYLGVSAKLSPGAPHGYGDFALVGGSLSQPELLQVSKKDTKG